MADSTQPSVGRSPLNLIRRLRGTVEAYPSQFWLLFWGVLVSATGNSMVWPFMTIYMRRQFGISLTAVTLLLTLNSVAGLIGTGIAGPVVDRFGRKVVMVMSLIARSGVMLTMSRAGSVQLWALLMMINGAFGPLYRVGSNAMVADLIGTERRAEAYALMRMISNAGIAIGPAVGGFVTDVSYGLAFSIAALASGIFAALVGFFVRETLPQEVESHPGSHGTSGGYKWILRDWPFMAFCGAFTLVSACATLMMVLLPVYAKENFGVPENRYGFIMSTNAAMVVIFQYLVTRVTERHRAHRVMAVGAFFYALGVGSVAWGWGFPTFLVSMIVMTIGELMLMPTGTTLTANLAPADMRGRYMGVYSLTWRVGYGIGPVIGGLLNDNVAPVAIWYGGLVMGLISALGFLLLGRVVRTRGRREGKGSTRDQDL